jgi:uncharacterized membrane protein
MFSGLSTVEPCIIFPVVVGDLLVVVVGDLLVVVGDLLVVVGDLCYRTYIKSGNIGIIKECEHPAR